MRLIAPGSAEARLRAGASRIVFMSFETVDSRTDFPALERDVLEFWEKTKAFETLREKNRGNQKWSVRGTVCVHRARPGLR